jgi:hypothetical protein
MELISNVAIVMVPRWVRASVIGILAALALLYMGLGFAGIYDNTRPGWLEASTYILGILLPLVLIGLLVGFSHSGVDALIRRNARFLRQSIPAMAALLGDPPGDFVPMSNVQPKDAAPPRILVQSAANLSIANYCVTITPEFAERMDGLGEKRQIAFRIELNATKANVNVLLPLACAKQKPETIFPHSIRGAANEGYWFAQELIGRKWRGIDYVAIVAARKLDADFLTNPVKQIDFGQDLMFMLRSMLWERPELFQDDRLCE